MKKRILSGLLAVLLAASLTPGALAAGSMAPAAGASVTAASVIPDETQAAQVLAALDIMVGDSTGALNLGANVSRAEFVKMAVAATPAGAGVGAASTSPYPDVPKSHWAAGYVQAGVEFGLITGYLDGTFRPSNTITLAEGVTVVLRLLGYQNSDFAGAYPSGQMAKYFDLKLDRGVSAGQNSPMTRRDCLYLFYNLLTATSKTTGQAYIYSLGHTLTSSGEIDLVALVNSAMEGPVVVDSGWQDKLSFDPSTAREVYRGGRESSYSALQKNDVVYWSKSMRTLWAYTTQATGTITAITPTAAPTSVTVAGKTYSIETSAAAYALSDLGTFKTGDTVTLLLGRSGGVAAVQSSSNTSSVVYGLVESVAPGAYTDSNGNEYTANTLTIRATDGSQQTYRCDDKNIKAGALVQVSTAGGAVTVTRLSGVSLSGKFSSDGAKLGSRSLASDVEILDTYENTALRIYPSRLAGVSLSENAVRYYHLNSTGEISHLILKDVTGDLHQYGVVTSVNEAEAGMTIMGSYVYDLNGQSIATGPLSKTFSVSVGPARFLWSDGSLKSITNLTAAKLSAIDGKQALAGNKTYPLSESVAVYELRNNKYYLSSLSIVDDGTYALTGYYDAEPVNGGVIRVLVARALS